MQDDDEAVAATQLDTETIVNDPTTRYFLIKSYNQDNLGRSLQHGVWATSQRNDRVFSAAYQTSAFVVLFFSVNHSSRFSGFAVMTSPPGGLPELQGKSVFCGPDGSPFPGRLFGVYWVTTTELFFRDCEHLHNSFNEGKPIKVGRDGQEIDPESGRELASLLDRKQKATRPRPLLLLKSRTDDEEHTTESLGEEEELPDVTWTTPPRWNMNWLSQTLQETMIYSIYPLNLTQFETYDDYLACVSASKYKLRHYSKDGEVNPVDMFDLPTPLSALAGLRTFHAKTALLLLARSAPWHQIVQFKERT